MRDTAAKIAVVLMNLGGPVGPESIRPFLESLFGDPAILPLPGPLRRPLAWILASARLRTAKAHYALIGGGSPLLEETMSQAIALKTELLMLLDAADVEVFIAMRHAPPSTGATAIDVSEFEPDHVVLLPLYPQFSTTTTASSLSAWQAMYTGPGENHPICCWYDNPGLVEAHAELIDRTWKAAGSPKVRLLFSAHGLPKSVIEGGDPYQWQVEATCAQVAARLGPSWDWQICYQSRVGPMKWLGPSTPEAIVKAAADGLGVLVDPIAFVSEHVETLVELDHDYRRVASAAGAAPYLRAPAVAASAVFIAGLAGAVARALERRWDGPDGAPCPTGLGRCGRAAVAEVAS
jgi:ferrochelatase